MKRREFVRGAAVAGAAVAGAGALSAPAIAQGVRELKLVTTWPKNFPGLGTGAQRMADRITAATGGQITVKLFAAGELVPPFESFDAVSNGTADMYHGAEYYWQGKSKAFNFFAAVPFGFTASEFDSWIQFGGGQELWDKLSGDFNIKPFTAGNTGVHVFDRGFLEAASAQIERRTTMSLSVTERHVYLELNGQTFSSDIHSIAAA